MNVTLEQVRQFVVESNVDERLETAMKDGKAMISRQQDETFFET